MPKIVDPDERRELIAAALWRVVQQDGIPGTSVRTVAAEAGLSPGALRHYFASQTDLLRFAAEAMWPGVEARVRARTRQWQHHRPSLDDVAGVVEEVVPLDARRRAEFEVWLELVLLARTTPELREVPLSAHRGLHGLFVDLVLVARHRDPSSPTERRRRETQLAADSLHALVDGLSLHLALYPGETSRARARAAVHAAVEEIAGSGSA